jgi:hypothetical protein
LKVIGFIVLGIILSGCGSGTGSPNNSSGWSETTSGGTPILLTKQINECFTSFNQDSNQEIMVYRFIDGFSSKVKIDFNKQIRTNYVESLESSGPIIRSYYGTEISYLREFEYIDEYEDYIQTTQTPFKFDIDGELLSVCPGFESYEKDSYENAGLSISHTITQTYNNIKAANADIELEPISVYVAPLINVESKYIGGIDNKTIKMKTETDNAFYNPNKKMIAFLPHSVEKEIAAPYWEIPMVAAHEYGHHVFNTLIGSKIKKLEKKSVGNCFKEHSFNKSALSAAVANRSTSATSFTLRAMNDGFADLIAYYTNSESERGLSGVKCFEFNREISSSTFGDGTKKYFSAQARRTMDSSSTIADDGNCNTPNFQRIHETGATFAYVIDRILDKYTTSQKNKLGLLLKITPIIAAIHEQIPSVLPSYYLQVNIEYFVKVLDSFIEDESKRLGCSLVKEHMYLSSGSCLILKEDTDDTARFNELFKNIR